MMSPYLSRIPSSLPALSKHQSAIILGVPGSGEGLTFCSMSYTDRVTEEGEEGAFS